MEAGRLAPHPAGVGGPGVNNPSSGKRHGCCISSRSISATVSPWDGEKAASLSAADFLVVRRTILRRQAWSHRREPMIPKTRYFPWGDLCLYYLRRDPLTSEGDPIGLPRSLGRDQDPGPLRVDVMIATAFEERPGHLPGQPLCPQEGLGGRCEQRGRVLLPERVDEGPTRRLRDLLPLLAGVFLGGPFPRGRKVRGAVTERPGLWRVSLSRQNGWGSMARRNLDGMKAIRSTCCSVRREARLPPGMLAKVGQIFPPVPALRGRPAGDVAAFIQDIDRVALLAAAPGSSGRPCWYCRGRGWRGRDARGL